MSEEEEENIIQRQNNARRPGWRMHMKYTQYIDEHDFRTGEAMTYEEYVLFLETLSERD